MMKRIVLKGAGAHEVFTRLAWAEDWDLADVHHTEGPFVEVWADEVTSTEIHYVEDDLVGHRYIVLHGKDTRTIEKKIRKSCSVWNPTDALLALDEATERDCKLTALYAAALSADETRDSGLVRTLRELATIEEDHGVRQAVVVIAGYLQWPQLVRLVEEMKDNDPSEQVRTNAEVMWEGIRLHRRENDS